MKRSLRTIFCALLASTLATSVAGVVAVPAPAQDGGQSPWVDSQVDPNFAPKPRLFSRPDDIAIRARAIMPFPDRDPTGIYSEKDLRTLRWGRSPTHRLIVGEAEVPGGTLLLSEVWAGGCSNDKGGSFCPAKLVLRRPGKPDAVLFDGELSMPSGTARYVRADLSAIESPERKGGWAPLEKAR